MYPYLLMLAVTAVLALIPVRKPKYTLLAVALLYWLMIGFRFQVGMDWNNYLLILQYTNIADFWSAILRAEPAFWVMAWLFRGVDDNIILINAISALIFCWGFFSVARRCLEPFLAIVVATPLLVVVNGMSATRQAMALGVIFYLFATWERGGTLRRVAFVVGASLFHFSALFVMVFVALASRASPPARLAAVGGIGAVTVAILSFGPARVADYSELYVSGTRIVNAPGALAHVLPIAVAGLLYFLYRNPQAGRSETEALYKNLAIGGIAAIPAIYFSSVGAFRFALYFWPMAMAVWSGLASKIARREGRTLYRLAACMASAAVLWAWLSLANTSRAWIPYENWLLQPDEERLYRHRRV